MSKHTPGPWHWHNCGGYHVLVSGPPSEEGRYPDGPQVISDGSAGGEYSADIDVDGPDAKLIAAAPDMLAALEAIEAHHLVLNASVGRNPDRSHTISLAREAIRKARGE